MTKNTEQAGIDLDLDKLGVLARAAKASTWTAVKHNWSNIGIYSGGRPVACLSIIDDATEENQDELEAEMDADAEIMVAACNALPALIALARRAAPATSDSTARPSLLRLIADDGYAMSFQSIGQYRSALLKAGAVQPVQAGEAAGELHIGVSNNDQGVHINILQRLADGTASVIYAAKAPAGDSYGRFTPVATIAAGAAAAPAQAALDVLAERRRQVEKEGYDPEHDDGHVNDEIAALATFYAMPPAVRDWPARETGYGSTWGRAIMPLNWVATNIGGRRRELVKAGALILAEIDRIDRAAIAQATPKEQN